MNYSIRITLRYGFESERNKNAFNKFLLFDALQLVNVEAFLGNERCEIFRHGLNSLSDKFGELL